MQPFPVLKKLLTSGSPRRVIEVQVYCYCQYPDDGSKMVACDGECGNWFHVKCINATVHRNRKWHCKICTSSWLETRLSVVMTYCLYIDIYIRKSVDSLCRDGADVQYMQYLRWQGTLCFQGQQTWNPS